MAEPVFAPIPVEYAGLYADDAIVDLQDLGVSLQGVGKLSNSVVNFYLTGDVVADPRLYRVRVFGGPPKSGTLVYELFAVLITGEFPLYARVLVDLAGHFVPHIVRAMIAGAVGRHADSEAMIDKIADLASQHAEFARDVHQGHIQDKEWLQSHISILTARSGTALKETVKPIGKSARRLSIGTSEPAVIEEAEAEVLTSKEDLQVGEMTQFRGVFDGVDTTNGNCKVRVNDDERILTGKITDPALTSAGNIYTHSLDTRQPVMISAKPVVKDGEIVRLFISDGNFITDLEIR